MTTSNIYSYRKCSQTHFPDRGKTRVLTDLNDSLIISPIGAIESARLPYKTPKSTLKAPVQLLCQYQTPRKIRIFSIEPKKAYDITISSPNCNFPDFCRKNLAYVLPESPDVNRVCAMAIGACIALVLAIGARYGRVVCVCCIVHELCTSARDRAIRARIALFA